MRTQKTVSILALLYFQMFRSVKAESLSLYGLCLCGQTLACLSVSDCSMYFQFPNVKTAGSKSEG